MEYFLVNLPTFITESLFAACAIALLCKIGSDAFKLLRAAFRRMGL